uniref:NAD(P)-dependent dehydrogenase, short-chain alcohol dehydrogenase family n=1 Tax=Candidatus Kentrum sp. TC TaxID=2126339 RepID=A0A450ZTZ5_9GAMM|nr:MAG: NAD(P)-dependent dehydrogenase, short-chain alcohol dehydrogenase family [Candidatus Kentron sp. TC]
MSIQRNLFLTGVSSGLGHALAARYLDFGWRVFGISRREPDNLGHHPDFRFRPLDLREQANAEPILRELLDGVEWLDLAILNAGTFGQVEDLANIPLADLQDVMAVNVWANKAIIDGLYTHERRIWQIVTISSGASVNGNRGWAGYAISKAALNMLTKLYAREHPDTHFCALAPGIVHTPMAEDICRRLSGEERFPAIRTFCAKRNTKEMFTPVQAAEVVMDAIRRLPTLVESGAFADARGL